MNERELREKIFYLVTDPPCWKCGFWDEDGHCCFLRITHEDMSKCKLITQILALLKEWLKEAGWVKLADDQRPPKNPYIEAPHLPQRNSYSYAQQDMLNAVWRKVEVKDGS